MYRTNANARTFLLRLPWLFSIRVQVEVITVMMILVTENSACRPALLTVVLAVSSDCVTQYNRFLQQAALTKRLAAA